MRVLVFLLALMASPVAAVTCDQVMWQNTSFTVCEVDAESEDLRLFLRDEDGDVLGQFGSVEDASGGTLAFAMNAGMYHADRGPVGYYVENGVAEMRVIPNAGPGNFGLLPNGILCLTDTSAQVYETLDFIARQPDCRDATQSGPMLVIDGALHPRFIAGSDSTNIRNGVGTSADGRRAVFAISDDPVNFYDFGTLFRDKLDLPNALFFDGRVSRLYAPQIGRSDIGFALGPIIGVVE